nr:hypothetical protein [Bacteroidota bacterium]
MAKTIRDEQLKLNVVINGDQAKHELFELENANRKLKTANKELFAEKVKLERAGKKETEQYREVTSAIKKNNKEIRENESRMKQLRSEIGITGLTFAQLSRRARDLRFAINNMTPGSPERRKLELELTKINARMKQVRAGAVQTGFSMQKMADGFNKYFGIVTAVLASLTGLYFSFKQLISGSAELSDKLADVRKTTGLTEKKVRELAKSLKTIDTRSSRSELL